jgi:hypothetical protein
MTMKKVPSWLKGSVATHRGYETKAGELLKSIRLTQEQINEWNEVEPVDDIKEPVEEISLKSKTKKELISIAESHGLVVNSKDTKSDIIYILETLV